MPLLLRDGRVAPPFCPHAWGPDDGTVSWCAPAAAHPSFNSVVVKPRAPLPRREPDAASGSGSVTGEAIPISIIIRSKKLSGAGDEARYWVRR